MVLLKSSSSSSSLVFKVRRNEPELVAPARPTPHERKLLSNLDDQKALRFHLTVVQFFPNNPLITPWDDFIHFFKEALSKALVFYYPFAGRIREDTKGKLMVDCTGEGVLFIQAEADVTLDLFGSDLLPPFPCFDDELLYNVPGSDEIINTPILTIQIVYSLHYETQTGATSRWIIMDTSDLPSTLPLWIYLLFSTHNHKS
ncbi:hypothetical protein PIB30_057567 [Stylosanthes scabra]|uniref:Uncharacterized protein n=1 Tax=Stylosanthes scabra TaxID=79078 RepID=A0ABU6ZIE8_9FABA|nr:hypothetical protein [Stylosanthes scabra]